MKLITSLMIFLLLSGSIKCQSLNILSLYDGRFSKDSGQIYQKLGIALVMDSSFKYVYTMSPYCKVAQFPRDTYFEVFEDAYLVGSIKVEPRIGSSRPNWTYPRKRIYLLSLKELNCNNIKVYQCFLNGKSIFTSDTLVHINKNYKFDLRLIKISIQESKIYFKKIKGGATKVYSMSEL